MVGGVRYCRWRGHQASMLPVAGGMRRNDCDPPLRVGEDLFDSPDV